MKGFERYMWAAGAGALGLASMTLIVTTIMRALVDALNGLAEPSVNVEFRFLCCAGIAALAAVCWRVSLDARD